jgi:hypothetical protein
MHIVPRVPPIIRVEMDGKQYEVSIDQNGAFVPVDLGEHMIKLGLVSKGELPEPQPRWERAPGGGWGRLRPLYEPWLKEV